MNTDTYKTVFGELNCCNLSGTEHLNMNILHMYEPIFRKYSPTFANFLYPFNFRSGYCQSTGTSQNTLKRLVPVDWQQPFYRILASASRLAIAILTYFGYCQSTGTKDFFSIFGYYQSLYNVQLSSILAIF